MKKEKKDKAMELVAALRSGQYQQIKNALRGPDGCGYCCLGVACQISGVSRWGGHGDTMYLGELVVMPSAVVDYYGFGNETGSFDPSAVKLREGMRLTFEEHGSIKIMEELTALNDRGWTFAQIADFIEDNWEHL